MNHLHIVFSSDSNCGRALGVTIYSLLASMDKDTFPHIYVLDGGIHAKDKKLIDGLDQVFNCEIIYHNMDGMFDQMGQVNPLLSRAAYYRSAIPKLLPDNISRVLYMDVDIVILKDLFELQNIDLNGHPLGVIEDPFSHINVEYAKKRIYSHEGLNINEKNRYFISSPLVIDLDQFREISLIDQFQNCFDKYGEKLFFMDQDIFNILFEGKVKYIEPIWGFVPVLDMHDNQALTSLPGSVYSEKNYSKAKESPSVVHFAGRKPCLLFTNNARYWSNNTRQDEYYKIWQSSPWKKEFIFEYYYVIKICELMKKFHIKAQWVKKLVGISVKTAWFVSRPFAIYNMARLICR